MRGHLKAADAADLLGITKDELRQLRRDGKIEAHKPEGEVHFWYKKTDLEAYKKSLAKA